MVMDANRGGRRRQGSAQVSRAPEICFQCRNRKVKCPGRSTGGCENCRRLKFTCSFNTAESPENGGDGRSETSTPGVVLETLQRRRVRRACLQCREHKCKCSGGSPSCARCLSLRIPCQYPNSTTGRGARVSGCSPLSMTGSHETANPRESGIRSSPRGYPSETVASAISARSSMTSTSPAASSIHLELPLNRVATKLHIDAFFELIYPIPCYGFIHKASFMQTYVRGIANPRLLRAICGITSRFIAHTGNETASAKESRRWTEEAEAQLFMRSSQPSSLSDLEAWAIITLDHGITRNFIKSLVALSLMARLAYMMRLNHEDNKLDFITQERRRRLMWSIFVMETLYSSGRAEYTSCHRDLIHVRLPCDEISFSRDEAVVTEPLIRDITKPPAVATMGLMGYCTRLLDIRDRTQRLVLTITNHREQLSATLPRVEQLEAELLDLQQCLPSHYVWDAKNLFLRAYEASRIPFVMFHAWWHQTHSDLFRFAVPGIREGLPSAEIALLQADYAASCREKCFSHALAVSHIMSAAVEAGIDLITDPSLAMCAFHSARIISRLGLPPLGNVPQEHIVERLQSCADALEEQSKLYPTTAILRSGVLDLIHDAQRSPRGSSPMRSSWESGEGSDEPDASTRDVYSKYSMTEEIRKLKFRTDDSGEGPQDQSPALAGSSTSLPSPQARLTTTESGMPPSNNNTSPSRAPQLNSSISQPQGTAAATIPMYQNFAAMGAGPPTGYTTGYDVAMTLGFDPSYDNSQPDMFLDSFWPGDVQEEWWQGHANTQMGGVP